MKRYDPFHFMTSISLRVQGYELMKREGISDARCREVMDFYRSGNEMPGIRILDAIDARLEAGKSVYVHCWGGIGRTGTVAGCWLARHGEEDPLQTLHTHWVNSLKAKRGKLSPETEEQCRFIEAWKAGE